LTFAVHNPSSNPLNEVRISIPKGFDKRWTAQVFVNESFKEVNSTTSCSEETLENGVSIDNCYLYIDYPTIYQDVNLFKVEYKGDCDIVKPYKPLSLYEKIESDELEVYFNDFSKNNSEIMFTVVNKAKNGFD
jgi:hypothetical protein